MITPILANIEWGTVIGETLLMTFISTAISYLFGLPIGIILKFTSASGLKPNKPVNAVLGLVVNFLRSVPALILLVILIPLTRSIFGTASGKWYTMIIPLFLSSLGFVSRLVEQSLQDVDPGEVEAIKSMGATNFQIIRKVLIPEARSTLVIGVSVTLVNVIGYTSFAYNTGAGGLISAIYSFYTRNTADFTSSWEFWLMVLVVIIIVSLIQEAGLYLAKKLDKRKKVK
ncbi:MAG: ABC transporter permease subunit [Bacillota bacterium]|nr:ABC transporter permease subunit [Bacillota bacterium]